jgi:hypothetical protein
LAGDDKLGKNLKSLPSEEQNILTSNAKEYKDDPFF